MWPKMRAIAPNILFIPFVLLILIVFSYLLHLLDQHYPLQELMNTLGRYAIIAMPSLGIGILLLATLGHFRNMRQKKNVSDLFNRALSGDTSITCVTLCHRGQTETASISIDKQGEELFNGFIMYTNAKLFRSVSIREMTLMLKAIGTKEAKAYDVILKCLDAGRPLWVNAFTDFSLQMTAEEVRCAHERARFSAGRA
jgi:hypothetical protein